MLRFINFAHSDVLMLDAYSAFFLAPVAERIFGTQSIAGALFIIVIAAAICAVVGVPVLLQVRRRI